MDLRTFNFNFVFQYKFGFKILLLLGLQAVMAEARSQQAASMTEFHWLGNRFPISNAKTRVSILKGQ